MMLVVTSVAVAMVCFILYALDRRSREKPVEWTDGLRLSVLGGLISAGVVFSSTGIDIELPPQIVAPIEQEIFVGVPNF